MHHERECAQKWRALHNKRMHSYEVDFVNNYKIFCELKAKHKEIKSNAIQHKELQAKRLSDLEKTMNYVETHDLSESQTRSFLYQVHEASMLVNRGFGREQQLASLEQQINEMRDYLYHLQAKNAKCMWEYESRNQRLVMLQEVRQNVQAQGQDQVQMLLVDFDLLNLEASVNKEQHGVILEKVQTCHKNMDRVERSVEIIHQYYNPNQTEQVKEKEVSQQQETEELEVTFSYPTPSAMESADVAHQSNPHIHYHQQLSPSPKASRPLPPLPQQPSAKTKKSLPPLAQTTPPPPLITTNQQEEPVEYYALPSLLPVQTDAKAQQETEMKKMEKYTQKALDTMVDKISRYKTQFSEVEQQRANLRKRLEELQANYQECCNVATNNPANHVQLQMCNLLKQAISDLLSD